MPSSLVPFVGRATEVAAVVAALDAAAGAAASVMAVAGAPGVGKSRLVEETDALARARGFLTLRATASPLHVDLPYGIVVEALRPIMRTVEAGARTRLVEGLPDLGRLFDGLNLPAAAPLGNSAMERTRLFEAVCRLFDRLTHQQPVLLIVDDLHWADPTSLALLDYVIRGLADRRFLLLVTHRTGEATTDIEALRRSSGLFRAVTIEALDVAGVAALARGLLADDPPATLTSLLVERTRGLPLFVRALVTMLIDSGRLFRSGGRWVLGPEPIDEVPAELIGLLRSRLDALPAAVRRVFDTVSVAGGTAGHELMSALHADEDELLDCVKRLRAGGLLAEGLDEAGVRYEVTHPLLAEVAYGDLPAVARRRIHAALAAALRRSDQAAVGRLAHHVRGAGDEVDPDTALNVLVAATHAALDTKAGAEAATHAEAAIALAQQQGRDDLVSRLRGQRAEALELAGPADAAIDAWRAAIDTATSTEDRARWLQRLAVVEWDAGRLADSQTHIEEAVAALAGTPIGPVHLAVLEVHGRMLARRGQLAELRTVVSQLDRLAEATGSARIRAFARWSAVDLYLYDGDHDEAERAVSAMMRLAQQDNSILLLEEAHRPAVCNAMAWGDHATARRLGEEGRELARQIGVPALEILVSVFLAYVDFVAGNWDEATVGADRALADSHRTGMRRGAAAALCLRALVHTRRGEHGDATACLREGASLYAEGFAADRHLLSIGDVCQAMILLDRGDGGSALRVARSIQPSGLANPALCLGILGEAQVAVGDPAGARKTARSLARHGPGAPYPAAMAARIMGLAARAEGDTEAASVAFERAGKGFDALGMPFDAAVARLDWAETDGTDRVRDDLQLFDRLGARPAADRARKLLRRLGVRPPVTSRTRQGDELSPREAEIAQLVAEGLSNMEIAERLFISHRTVTTHLQRIYQRLGVTSRTGLTRYVLEQLRNT